MSVTVPFDAQDDAGHATAPAVVYLAAARNTYGTLAYRRALRRLAERWPRAAIMDSEACGFSSRADWYLRWPVIREGIDSLVVLSEEDGSISRETWLELRGAMESGTRCWFVTSDATLAPSETVRFRLYPSGDRTDRRWARAVVRPDS
jgi:hypothetical protein